MSTRLLWIWKAGVIQLPQLHWMPDQLKKPKRASQWAQDNLPSIAPSLTGWQEITIKSLIILNMSMYIIDYVKP